MPCTIVEKMSLKAKIEAVIYAAEEPVTLAQLAGIFAQELPPEPEPETQPHIESQIEEGYLETESFLAGNANELAKTAMPVTRRKTNNKTRAANPIAVEAEAKRVARQWERQVREQIKAIVDELIEEYSGSDRGMEIREVAGGYRIATKPEYHDAVRAFVKSLKPPMKLSLQALETLAVIAYKQPVTAPEVAEIRGVDSSGVLGSLVSRKLITTAGRKQVIGRPILYKTTREFLLRFGLKDLNELPSIEEFEKLASDIEIGEEEKLPSKHPVCLLKTQTQPLMRGRHPRPMWNSPTLPPRTRLAIRPSLRRTMSPTAKKRVPKKAAFVGADTAEPQPGSESDAPAGGSGSKTGRSDEVRARPPRRAPAKDHRRRRITSRRKAEELITEGRVQVNGQTVVELGAKADAALDHIRVDGKLLAKPGQGTNRLRYAVLNKPRGYITSASDPEGRPTVMKFFPGQPRVFPVGRLDYQSEGLLLMTNDGELANLLTRAANKVPKVYLVKISGKPSDEALNQLRSGIMIDKGRTKDEKLGRVLTQPAGIRRVRDAENPWYEVTLIEGRNREIRKMFEEVGHFVEKIRRVGYGPLVLDVEPGEVRELNPDEVLALQRAARGIRPSSRLAAPRRRCRLRQVAATELNPVSSRGLKLLVDTLPAISLDRMIDARAAIDCLD